ncbi:MAG: ABC transporter substrate-binding protein [Chloroflexota bacterium]|jgi:peptide/nickel transport system substrate-binding protein
MKKFRWQIIIILLTGLVVGILLLSEQPEGITQIAPEPVTGGFYTEALIGSLQRLNPLLDYYNSVDRDVNRLIYSRLLTFDERGIPVADLAASWSYSQDGTIYNFEIRPDVKWHDGEPLTTADIVFTVDLMRNGGAAVPEDIQRFWRDIEAVALNEILMQFKLPEPFAPFLDYLTFGIVPEHLLGGRSIDEIKAMQFNIQPVGSGPYRFDQLIVEDGRIAGVSLLAFEDYYGKQPYIPQIIFRYYPDAESALQAYRNDQVQGIGKISETVLPAALAESDLAIYTSRRPELSIILFNLKNPEKTFLQNEKIRRALYMGINRQYLIDRVLNGQAILADGPIFPGTWAYFDGLPRVEFNPERAAQILVDQGYTLPAEGGLVRVGKDGDSLEFTLLVPDTPQHLTLAESIQQDWASLNVGVTLEVLPYADLIEQRLTLRDYQAALVDLNLTRSPDPDPYPFWDSIQATSGQNYSQWDDKIASEYLEEARITIDLNERARLYRNFQVIFADQIPALPLFYPVYNYGVDRQVQGVRMGPLLDSSDRFVTILEWYLTTRPVEVTPTELTPTP